ncbi:hypothetical protein FKP32DRAFT_135092 [Trametes sanguinea]|nr:hypothetical protein FKP32DRAFT_135092 [Trametes sanguinea]
MRGLCGPFIASNHCARAFRQDAELSDSPASRADVRNSSWRLSRSVPSCPLTATPDLPCPAVVRPFVAPMTAEFRQRPPHWRVRRRGASPLADGHRGSKRRPRRKHTSFCHRHAHMQHKTTAGKAHGNSPKKRSSASVPICRILTPACQGDLTMCEKSEVK